MFDEVAGAMLLQTPLVCLVTHLESLIKTIFWTALLALVSCRAACAGVVAPRFAPRYDLRVRLQAGEGHLVKHSGEIAGTMVISGRKIVSSVKSTTSYEVRVLESRGKKANVRLTLRSNDSVDPFGTSGGVTLYAPYSATIEEPTSRVFNGDAIRGQSVDLEILPNGDVTPDFGAPPSLTRDTLMKKDYEAKTPAEKQRARRELFSFEMKHQMKLQATEKFRWFIGVRPTKRLVIGESWHGHILLTVSHRIRRVPVFYKLAKVENNVAFVSMRVNEQPEKKARVSMPKNMKDSSWNLQNGTMQIDLKSGWPLRTKEIGQSFSQIQTVEQKGARPQNFLTTYGKSLSQAETTALSSSHAP